MIIKPMNPEDLTAMLDIQTACYTEITPESKESLASKLMSSPSTCFVAYQNDCLIGYLISLPSLFSSPFKLNALHTQLDETPDCLYLHDLAISPSARGLGVAAALIEQFFKQFNTSSFQQACLIAIQHSVPFWSRYGFTPAPTDVLSKEKLASYGSDATYMICQKKD